MIKKEKLVELYWGGEKSMQEIADALGCSLHKVSYWMDKHTIERRSRSVATYLKHNPDGDPFQFKKPTGLKSAKLMGLGLGLYWGEGTKANKHSVRLGNTDPDLIKSFIEFLIEIYNVKKGDMKFGLQIFSDVDPKEALSFWIGELGVKKEQFQKPIITPSRGGGTYRKKLKYGVLTVYFNNKKLRDILVDELNKLRA